MKCNFPYTDYHTYNLDWLVDKMNSLATYVKESIETQVDGAKRYIKKLYPYVDEEGATVEPAFEVQDVGANVERTTNDGDSLRLRVYSPELATETDRGTIAFSGSEMKAYTPHVKLKDGNGNTLDVQGNTSNHTVYINGSDDYTKIYYGDTDNRVTLTNVAEPVNNTDVATKYYVDSNIPDVSDYVDTEDLRDGLFLANDNVAQYRTSVTGDSALNKGEIIDLIEEYITPSNQYMVANYDRDNIQAIGREPVDSSTGDSIMWNITHQTGSTETNGGYIGFHKGMVNGNYDYTTELRCYSTTKLFGWGWNTYQNGLERWMTTSMWFDSSVSPTIYFTDFAVGNSSTPVTFHNMATPTNADEGANKAYVDAQAQAVREDYEQRIARLETQIETLMTIVRENNN